jgi:hypothetical protein
MGYDFSDSFVSKSTIIDHCNNNNVDQIQKSSTMFALVTSSHVADLPLRQSVCILLQHLVNFGITPELNCNSFSLILSIKII